MSSLEGDDDDDNETDDESTAAVAASAVDASHQATAESRMFYRRQIWITLSQTSVHYILHSDGSAAYMRPCVRCFDSKRIYHKILILI